MELRQRVKLGPKRRTRFSELDALRGGPASGGVPLLLKLIRAVDLAQREIIGLLLGLQILLLLLVGLLDEPLTWA